ncbi:Alpha/Beta hydrolase protein [Mycena polygramma]|nr:Alpha/Beta hydrolase protein [Mycena polygramma]
MLSHSASPSPIPTLRSSRRSSKLRALAHPSDSTPTNDNPDDHSLGLSLEWLKNAKHEWETGFDWRAQERTINSFPQFMAKVPVQVEGKEYIHDIHFLALFSKRADAVPLIMFHGWPGSFFEFIPIVRILSTKYTADTLPYHVIVPSLPGYGFSSGPQTKAFKMAHVAAIFNDLMLGLGFEKYIALGGDVGSCVARILSTTHENCKAIHLNMLIIFPPESDDPSAFSPAEREAYDRGVAFRETGWAYALEQGTRPNTLGLVLSSSPLALLAWIGEKMLEWSDKDPPLEVILTDVSIYWFTNSISTSFYPYREPIAGGAGYYKYHDKPVGYTWFPREIIPAPESWAKKEANLVFYRQAKAGGHFAALEVPEVLLKDVEDFVEQVRGSL